MINVNEARKISDEANFAKSGYAELLDTTIRDIAKEGGTKICMVVPTEVAESTAEFLQKHGFRVVADRCITGITITAAW